MGMGVLPPTPVCCVVGPALLAALAVVVLPRRLGVCAPRLLHARTHGADGSWSDPEVWTNAAFLVPAVVAVALAPRRPQSWVLGATLVALSLASGYFHRVQHGPGGGVGLLADRLGMALVIAAVGASLSDAVWPRSYAAAFAVLFLLLAAGALDCHWGPGWLWAAVRTAFVVAVVLWWFTTPPVQFDGWILGTILLAVAADALALLVPTRLILGMSGHAWKHVVYAAALSLFAVWAARH